MISPAAAIWRTICITLFCASSTSARLTIVISAISSRIVSAARCDMVARHMSTISSSAPLSAIASWAASTERSTLLRLFLSRSRRFSKMNISSSIAWARMRSCFLSERSVRSESCFGIFFMIFATSLGPPIACLATRWPSTLALASTDSRSSIAAAGTEGSCAARSTRSAWRISSSVSIARAATSGTSTDRISAPTCGCSLASKPLIASTSIQRSISSDAALRCGATAARILSPRTLPTASLITVGMRVSAPIASALTSRLRVTKRSSACPICCSLALAVSNIDFASWRTSSGASCFRIVAASLSSSSINRMAAADDPSIAGVAATVSISAASGTGALLHQVADDERGARRILADKGADKVGARFIAWRLFDHFERDFAATLSIGEGGAIGRGEQRRLERLILFGALGGALLGGADHRAADEQEGEQGREDGTDLLDQRHEPALVVKSGRAVLDLRKGALVDRDQVAARRVITDRTLDQRVDLGEVGLGQRLLALVERDGDRDTAQLALRGMGYRNLAPDFIGARGIFIAFGAGCRGRAGGDRLRSGRGDGRRLRRLVRQRAGDADGGGVACPAGRACDLFAGQRAVVFGEAFARRLAFRHIDVGMDLDGVIAGAEHRAEQRVERAAEPILDLKLELEGLHVAAARRVRQQRAALVDHRHLIGVHAGDRRSDKETDRLHLAVGKRAAVLERQHD